MESLFPELIQMVYNHLQLPKDSCRFASTCTTIRNSLPEQLHLLHQWYRCSFAHINELKKCKYEVFDIYLCEAKCLMSIRKNYNNVSIYQTDPEMIDCPELYIYTYKLQTLIYIATLSIYKTKYMIDYDSSHDAYVSLDMNSTVIISSWLED